MKYFALVTRWLEDIALQDLQEQFPDAKIGSHAYKRIVFEYEWNPADLLSLKSVDDLFFYVDTLAVGKYRETLNMLKEYLMRMKIGHIVQAIQKLRWADEPSFSVSVSNVWDKNYTPKEIKEIAVAWIGSSFNRHEREDGDQSFNVRIFIEKEECLIGLRVAAAPLHRRAYKTTTLPGSLKAPVAYCMLKMAYGDPLENSHGKSLLDPMAGVGTIAFEAAALTSNIIAGDQSSEALAIIQESNMTDADIAFCQRDARHMSLEGNSIDHIVTNLPFGKQIEISEPETFFTELLTEFSRVLKPTGNIVVLTMHKEIISKVATELNLSIISDTEISLFWLNPSILLLQRK